MMYVLFQQDGRLKVDWQDNPAEINRNLVVIASAVAAAKHRPEDRACFRVVRTEDFTVDALEKIVREVADPLDPRELRLATFDDHLVAILGQLRTRLGIPGQGAYEAIAFFDKGVMKARLAGSGIRVPRHVVLDPARNTGEAGYRELAAALGSPFFVKPTGQAGSTGTAVIGSRADWRVWQAIREPGCEYEADEFINGTLFHADTILRSCRPPIVITSEYTVPNAEFLRGRTLGSIAMDPAAKITKELTDFNLAVLAALGASAGVYHLEAFATPAEDWVFLEVAARAPGAMITEMYKADFGINFQNETLLAQFSGESTVSHTAPVSPRSLAHAVWAWVPPRHGVVAKVNEPECEGAVTSYWRCQPGDELRPPEALMQRVGGIFVESASADAARSDFEYLRDKYQPLTMRGEEL